MTIVLLGVKRFLQAKSKKSNRNSVWTCHCVWQTLNEQEAGVSVVERIYRRAYKFARWVTRMVSTFNRRQHCTHWNFDSRWYTSQNSYDWNFIFQSQWCRKSFTKIWDNRKCHPIGSQSNWLKNTTFGATLFWRGYSCIRWDKHINADSDYIGESNIVVLITYEQCFICIAINMLNEYVFIHLLLPHKQDVTPIGLMHRVFTNGLGDRGSIPGRVIPKT